MTAMQRGGAESIGKISQTTALEYVGALLNCKSELDLSDVLVQVLVRDGCEYFAFRTLEWDHKDSGARLLTNFPTRWAKIYRECQYESIDPLLLYARRSVVPLTWDQYIASGKLNREQASIFDHAREFGICSGAAIPIHGPRRTFGIMTIGSALSSVEFGKIWSEKIGTLHLYTTYVHARISESRNPLDLGIADVRLSNRERECLLWAAKGMTVGDTAEKLGLHKSTVAGYVQSAMKKLKASTKTHAVIRAVSLGLVSP